MSDQDNLIYYGGAVKALGEGKIGGYLVRFGDEENTDLAGDFFTKSTNFGPHQTSLVFFQHGLDGTIQRKVLDPQAALKTDDVGVWIEAQLDLRDAYEAAIYGLTESGKMGWSSGTAPHLVERSQKSEGVFHIDNWPLGLDASITPTPAEPRTSAIPLKSIDVNPLVIEQPQETGEVSGAEDKAAVDINIKVITEETPMTEETKPQEEQAPEYASKDEVKALGDGFTDLGAKLDSLIAHIEESRPLRDTGYVAPDDTTGKKEVKSVGDFLVAIRRKNWERLYKVYGAVKDMSGESAGAGGVLVPQEMMNTLLSLTDESAQIVSRVTRQPVSSPSGSWPALDQYITPTAGSGNTAFAAGVSPATTSEGGAFGEASDPNFEMIEWRVSKVGDIVDVPNELIDDSGQSMEALLSSLFRVAINNKLEHYVIRGTGAGEPLGILNAGAAIGITPASDNAFGEADALSMLSRFKPTNVAGGPVWIMHRGVIPDFNSFTASNVDMVDWRSGVSGTLLGYPVLFSEHVPQDDNAGNVILADLGAYILFDRQQLVIDVSEHAKFENDLTVWRFKIRVDGQPWVKSAITLADPQGSYTVSPFVYHND